MRKTIAKFAVLAAAVLTVCCIGFTACGSDEEESAGGWQDFEWDYTNENGEDTYYCYSLYVPAAYDETTSLPLIVYIPDSSLVYTKSENSITKTKLQPCCTKWITDENMEKNPAFFLIFGVTSGFNFTDEGNTEGDQALKIIDKVVEDYNMDTNRLYLTGQSMGGIADFYLNDKYPEKFAATVYVGCQTGGTARDEDDPDYYRIINNRVWENQKFVYICSRKDQQAPYGQDDMLAVLDEDGLEYGGATEELFSLDHEDLDASNALVKAELDKGYSMNFFGFKQVTESGEGSAEHMNSFKYCYGLNCIFEWLMSQSLAA